MRQAPAALIYLLVFAVPLLVAAALAGPAGRLARRLGMVAVPGGRRQHSGRVPRLGGVPLLAGYLAGIGLAWWWLPPNSAESPLLTGVVAGSLVIFLGGLLDDRYDLPPYAQYLFQLIGVLIAVGYELFFERFTNPLTGAPVELALLLTFLVTLVWITGMMNAVNWLDGIDGLAAGVGAIAALMFAAHGRALGQTTIAAFPLALAGALIGLLPFNFYPARLFLGTAGVWLLGYNLATLAILAPAKIATALLVLALPLLDGAWRIVDRLRKGRSPFQGDREHLHFLLLDRGWSARRIAVSYYAVALVFGSVALLAPSGLIKLVVLTLLTVVILGLLMVLTRRPPQ